MNFILDETEDDQNRQLSKRGPKSRFILSISIVISALFFATTYAGNINIGNSSQQEFGQGVQITSSCDSSIDVKPIAFFKNDTETPGMYVDRFEFSQISEKCSNTLFILKAYAETGSALVLSSSEPFATLKFHFDSSGWHRDDFGCIYFNNSVVNSSESNSAHVKLSGCVDSWYTHNRGQNWIKPLLANQMYRYTLETRPYTIAKIDLSYVGATPNLGWAYHTGEGKFISVMSNTTSFSLFPDLASSRTFMVFVRISPSDFSDSSRNSNIYTATTSSNVSCTYDRKYPANSLIASGDFEGSYSPGGYPWVSYICSATGAGSISFA